MRGKLTFGTSLIGIFATVFALTILVRNKVENKVKMKNYQEEKRSEGFYQFI